jgi:hypothetical protein
MCRPVEACSGSRGAGQPCAQSGAPRLLRSISAAVRLPVRLPDTQTVIQLHLPVESTANTSGVVLLPVATLERLLQDQRRFDLVQPFKLAQLKIASQVRGKWLGLGGWGRVVGAWWLGHGVSRRGLHCMRCGPMRRPQAEAQQWSLGQHGTLLPLESGRWLSHGMLYRSTNSNHRRTTLHTVFCLPLPPTPDPPTHQDIHALRAGTRASHACKVTSSHCSVSAPPSRPVPPPPPPTPHPANSASRKQHS